MKKIIFMFFAILFAGNSFSQNQKISDNLQKKIHFLNPLEYTGVLIVLNDQIDIESLDKELYRINATLDYRAQTVINTLKQKAEQSQRPIIDFLSSENNRGKVRKFENYWIVNFIYAEVTTEVIMNLSTRAEIESIDTDNEILLVEPVRRESQNDNSGIESVETGLKVIHADKLWKLGLTGVGRTVMNIDTGVDGLHPALGPKWWGNNGRAWYHSWYDTSDSVRTYPEDCSDHGTHTMGTMCGRDSQTGDTVGVAPDAFWIAAAVQGCSSGGTAKLIASFQWAIDPDSNSTTMDMPDVINCSWRDLSIATSQCTSIYVSTLSAVEAAGIAVVFSAGNNGPGTSTIDPPININTDSLNTFSVGAVDGNIPGYPIADFSSRGPSICGGSGTNLIKPEVSAPGVHVRSTIPNSSYGFMNGTSMAAPHVAGSIALLKQAYPNLTGKQLKGILFSSSLDLGTVGEDNDYGKGLINLSSALQQTGYLTLNAFNINSPSAGTTITSLYNSSEIFTITWDTSCTGADYKWIFGSPNASSRLLTVSSNTNSITMTLGELDELLDNAGIAPGATLVGQWDIWSYTLTHRDSLKSGNGPRAITIKRGVPALSSFNLISPVSGTTLTTSAFNVSSININWSRSGEATTYKWKFGSPGISNVKISLNSGNNGYDTMLTLINNSLDGTLNGLGINPGDSIVGEWSVWAYNGFDSVKASQNNSLTIRREPQSNVLVIYDSTNTNCRISRDSVVANLNGLGLTYQQYNRKGSLATNSISFKGFDKVILLGEGNSVMSNSIKDSLKAYLTSGDSLRKAKLIIMAEDIGFHFDRFGSAFYDSAFCRSMCGFQFVADRPGISGAKGIVGVYINNEWSDSTYGPSTDVLKRSASVPSSETKNLYKYRLFTDSMNAIGRISETYNVAVFAVDIESLRPAFDSPAGSPVKRLLKGGLNFVDEIITSVNQTNMSVIPQEYSLSQNYPNPFNPATKINFSIPKQGLVTMKIYDALGKEVMTLVNETKQAGNYEVEFNGSNLASGAYFYRIESGEFTSIKRMMLIK